MKGAISYNQSVALLDDFKSENGWPPLQPITQEVKEEGQAFPFHGLGEVLGNAARAIAGDVQAPDALAGGSVLAAAALASSPLANVVMPHGQRSPLSLYIITGAASGDRKSATDAVACHAVEEKRKEQARAHIRAMHAWEGREGKHGIPETPQPNPQVLTTSNATVEGIARLLKFQSSVGIFSAEGGEMLGGHSLRDERRMSGMSFFLKGWGAEPLDSLRGGVGLSVLLGRRMSLHVMVQPVILGTLLADPLAQGQGLLARCLVAQPKSLAGSRLFKACDPLKNSDVLLFNERLRELLNQSPEVWKEGDGYELRPKDLQMSPEARAMWIAFFNQVEAAQCAGGALEGARPFASKAPEQAARIAGIQAVIENRDLISRVDMEGAIQIAAFYMDEHLRLTGVGKSHQRNKQLTALLRWMQERGPIVPHKTVLQSVVRGLRALKAEGLQDLLQELAHRGYIRYTPASAWEVRDVSA